MKTILTSALFIFTLGTSAQTVAVIQSAPSLTSGWIKIYDNDYIGYLNEDGYEIIPPIYDEIGQFGDYCDEGALVRIGDLYGLIDIYGNKIAKVEYEEIGRPGEYKPDWILVKKDGLYGFIDCSGEEVVAPVYTEIGNDVITESYKN